MKTSFLISQSLLATDLRLKVEYMNSELIEFQNFQQSFQFPKSPGRSASIVTQFRGPKEKISTPEGKARLLHDLCNIELQAMELALRTYLEFPLAPQKFRQELANLTRQEGEHLLLCLDELESRGFRFGDWPVHLNLWNTVSSEDSLLDRIFIVHRYLEGSGLDSGYKILTKLNSLNDSKLKAIFDRIHTDEKEHVSFGSHWYQVIAQQSHLDPEQDFIERLNRLYLRLPKRLDKIDEKLRRQAGFTNRELLQLNRVQKKQHEELFNNRDQKIKYK